MTQYVVLIPGDEAVWAAASDEQRAAMYQRHAEFAQLLAERGHKVTGGAELSHSSGAKVVRRSGESLTVTDGPYAETTEQLTGFYVVESEDLDDLLQVVGHLAGAEDALEVRACVDHSGSAG